jgi:hypothetical protein
MISAQKDPEILYFAKGAIPTREEQIEIFDLGGRVRVRNGSIDPGGSAPEKAAGVAGKAIPEAYQSYPRGADVLKAHRDAILSGLEPEQIAEDEVQETPQKKAPVAPKQSATAPAWVPQK